MRLCTTAEEREDLHHLEESEGGAGGRLAGKASAQKVYDRDRQNVAKLFSSEIILVALHLFCAAQQQLPERSCVQQFRQ